MSTTLTTSPSDVLEIQPADVSVPQCEAGIGSVITSVDSRSLIQGVRVAPAAVWPDDRGYFLEIQRAGQGLASGFPLATSQVSATLTYPGVVKAFHYHLKQADCWTVVSGMLQIALADLRTNSPTYGARNTIYVGDRRPWQVLIPPGIAHGYKVIGNASAMLVYVTSAFYDPSDECRIAFDDPRIAYDWNTQFK